LATRSALVTSGAMTIRLDRLERSGLVTRIPDPHDGRAIRVHLTPRGDDLARRALEAVIAADEAFLEPLSERQRDTIAAALRRLLAPYEQ
jgi:DNA-binding MarR family transcriptional regulator